MLTIRWRMRTPSGSTRAALVAAAVLVLVACGTNDSTAPAPSPTEPTPGTNATSPSPAKTPLPIPTISTRPYDAAWSEDFAGASGTPADPTLFTHAVGGSGWGNHELETYTDSTANSSLDGAGHLAITEHHEAATGSDGITRNWTSARLMTKGLWTFTYGTISARIKVPIGAGLWPAFWLLGADVDEVSWPSSGEIDAFETFDGATKIFTNIHGPAGSPITPYAIGGSQELARLQSYGSAFHTYSVERRFHRVTFLIDGRVVRTITPDALKQGQRWVFDKPMFLLFNVAVGGDWPQTPSSATPSTASMLIDWLRFTP